MRHMERRLPIAYDVTLPGGDSALVVSLKHVHKARCFQKASFRAVHTSSIS
jgi:hypothetical protein